MNNAVRDPVRGSMRRSRSTSAFILAVVIAFSTAAETTNFEIGVYECPCREGNCEEVNDATSTVWTTLLYESQGESVDVRIRLKKGLKESGCERGEPSDSILIDHFDQFNLGGQRGELQGTRKDSNETANIIITEGGLLSLFTDDYNREEQFTAESYCVRRLNSSHTSLEICCGHHHQPCIRKCCPKGQVFTFDSNNSYSGTCTEATTELGWNLPITNTSSEAHQPWKVRTGFPDCEKMEPYGVITYLSTALTKFDFRRQPYQLHGDGTLKFLSGAGRSFNTKWKTKADGVDYCVDKLKLPDDKLDMTCGEDEQDVLILCSRVHVKTFSEEARVYRILYMIGFSISILFLVVTALVHFLLWEKQNIHAWTILCYVLTLTGFYACLLLIYIEETRKRYPGPSHHLPLFSKRGCFALGMMTHFMGVFSFAWLSVINFDLWWTFRVLKPMNQRNFDLKRLLCYAAFAVTVPTVVVSIAGALQISLEKRSEVCRKTEEDHTIYPLYGEDGCFLANSSQPYYFYLPVGLLLLANFIFYMCTSCQMLRIYNATRQISNRSSQKQKQSCELFLKLFLVMGTTWIFQVILSVVEHDVPKWYSPIFFVLDLVNMFQAVAIFIIFVCKRETLRALEQKYICLKSFRGAYTTSTVMSRSTDGSTKMSRTELTKHSSIDSTVSTGSDRDYRRDSELINFS